MSEQASPQGPPQLSSPLISPADMDLLLQPLPALDDPEPGSFGDSFHRYNLQSSGFSDRHTSPESDRNTTEQEHSLSNPGLENLWAHHSPRSNMFSMEAATNNDMNDYRAPPFMNSYVSSNSMAHLTPQYPQVSSPYFAPVTASGPQVTGPCGQRVHTDASTMPSIPKFLGGPGPLPSFIGRQLPRLTSHQFHRAHQPMWAVPVHPGRTVPSRRQPPGTPTYAATPQLQNPGSHGMRSNPLQAPDHADGDIWSRQQENHVPNQSDNSLRWNLNLGQAAIEESYSDEEVPTPNPDTPATEPAASKIKKPRKARLRKKMPNAGEDVQPTNVIPSIMGQQPDPNWRKGDGIRRTGLVLKPSGRCFDTYEEMLQAARGPAWMPPADDATVPHTDDAILPYVDQLTAAIMDTTQYIDKESSVMKKRWLDTGFKDGQKNSPQVTNPFYCVQDFAEVAWRVAKLCQCLHLEGPGVLEITDPVLLEDSFDCSDLTYAQRIDMLAEVFRRSKSRAMYAMRGLPREYVLVPSNLLKTSLQNRENNDERQNFIKTGRTLVEKNGNRTKKRTGKKVLAADLTEDESISSATSTPTANGKRRRDEEDSDDEVSVKKARSSISSC